MNSTLFTETNVAVAGLQPLEFTTVEAFTTFSAEYAFDGSNIVIHFFLPPEVSASYTTKVKRYWEETFPQQLEATAVEVFKETSRLQASHVAEYGINSWHFRAFGFAAVPDPILLVLKFLSALDQGLDATTRT